MVDVMNVAIRVDASMHIGTGHLMRCLTLAKAITSKGGAVRFLCRHIPSHLENWVLEEGYELRLICEEETKATDEYIEWLGGTQAGDAQATYELLQDKLWDWLVVDQYALDIRWEQRTRGCAKYLCVIDDLANRSHDCDVLIDQNFYLEQDQRYVGLVPDHCRLLLGTRYTLLREEFYELSKIAKPRSGKIDTVMVFFGGIDQHNYTSAAIEALQKYLIDSRKCLVHVVVGLSNPYLYKIKAACDQTGFICHIQTNKMAKLIAQSDMVIGAGGSACWEFCALGAPPLIVITAENQRKLALDLTAYGAARLIGDYRNFSKRQFTQQILNAMEAPMENEACSRKALALFPEGSNGANCIAAALSGTMDAVVEKSTHRRSNVRDAK